MFIKLFKLKIILGLIGFSILNACQTESGNSDTPPSSKEEVDSSIVEAPATHNYVPERWIWQKPELVMDLLGDMTDKTVADIGAGLGYFSLALAQKAKKVIAIDINQGQLDFLEQEKRRILPERFQDRIETRLVPPDDPKIESEEADLILIVNTYIYLPNRVEYMRRLRDNLPEGGKILIVNFKKKRIISPPGILMPLAEDRVSLYKVEGEMSKAGFTILLSDDTSLDYQYIVLVEK